MTIPATPKRKDYTCDGSNKTFGYNWRVMAATDLKVVIRDLSGNDVTLTNVTDYTVGSVGNSSGGNVTTTVAYANGYHLTILPNLVIKQSTSFRNQNTFYPEKHEDALDYLTMLLQQQDEILGRCLKLDDTSTGSAYGMPPATPGYTWGWDASGNSVPLLGAPALQTALALVSGADLIGYNSSASYDAGTIGAALQAAQPGGAVRPADLADTTSASLGSGMVGYNSGLSYAAGTLGYAMKNAFNAAVPAGIGTTTPNSGAFTTLSSSGLSTLNSLSVTTTSTFTGAATFSSTVTCNGILNAMAGFREKKNALAASAIDCSTGNVFSKTISATTTFTVSNVPGAGNAFVLILDLTNGGAYAITWWSGVKWAAGSAPTLTASGRDLLGFITHDGGTTWSGFVLGKALA